MAASAEHQFISDAIIKLVRELSQSRLFGYTEADRGRFDFACTLTENHSRQLVGQTLTHHAEGIEKDLNQLLFADAAEMPVYAFSHTTKNEARIQEVLQAARSQIPNRVNLVRLLRYPAEFDADNELQRGIVRNALRDQIVEDLLLNVLFGRLSEADVSLLIHTGGMQGLKLATLETIASTGFLNFARLAQDMGGPSMTTLRRITDLLVSAGMLQTGAEMSVFRLSVRGRLMLKICQLLVSVQPVRVELAYVLAKIGLGVPADGIVKPDDDLGALIEPAVHLFQRTRFLVAEVLAAKNAFGVTVSGGPYADDGLYPDQVIWIGR